MRVCQTSAVAVRRIDHVQLAMPRGREAEAVHFYEGLLGLAQVPKPPPLAARGGCWFEQGDLKVHLGVEDSFRPARKAHPALLVDDLPELVERLDAAGVAVTREPLDGDRRVYVDDPFGNRIELLEPEPDQTSGSLLAGDRIDQGAALSALLDPNRLAVAGSLIDRVCTVDELVGITGLTRVVVLQALGALRQAGLVDPTDDAYTLRGERLRELSASVSETATPMDPVIGFGMTDAERAVLERFFSGRTLRRIPTDRPKRLVVLERIALEFDVGCRYRESEVDDVLRRFHLDVATLRRHLVDEDLLSRTREGGVTHYWRSGGRVPAIS
jgi:catechol 2,3-dioxygenase-like lactoylglutathione lyase family enzyme/DNA-binding transcriptional ArsR family regulator